MIGFTSFMEAYTDVTKKGKEARRLVERVLFPMVNKTFTLQQIEKKLSVLNDPLNIEFQADPVSDRKLAGLVAIAGYWESPAGPTTKNDAGEDIPIEFEDIDVVILLISDSNTKDIPITQPDVLRMTDMIVKTLEHEWVHIRQAEKSGFKNVKAKNSYYKMLPKDKQDRGKYLGTPTEVDAFAHNIISDIKTNVQHSVNREKLLRNLKLTPALRKISDDLYDYVNTFGVNHKVTKTLIRKIVKGLAK